MASPRPPVFRGLDPLQSRQADATANTVTPFLTRLAATPIMGAPAPPWIAPTLLTPWANFGGVYAKAGFHKDALGYVHVKGVLSNASGAGTSNVVFVLPVGYRPKETNRFAVEGNAVSAQFISVDAQGNVRPEVAVAASGSCDITCTFLAEQ